MLDAHRAPGRVHLGGVRRELLRQRRLAGQHRAGGHRSRRVELLDVVADHARGEDLRAEGRERVLEHRDPAHRQAGGVEVVEARRDALLHEVVERGGLEVVTTVGVGDAVGRGDRPAVLAVVPLVPPAVEDRQVETAVERGLHARRAARLERAQRVVEPHVAAGVEQARHADVVVREEHDAVPDLGVVGEVHELLDQLLAAVVGGVRLAGDDELHRTVGVQQQRLEPGGVAQHQGEPLVGRHATGEADREDVGVEDVVDPAELGVGRAALHPRLAQALADVGDEPLAQHALGRPQLAGGDRLGGLPALRLLGELGADLRREQVADLARDPGRARGRRW